MKTRLALALVLALVTIILSSCGFLRGPRSFSPSPVQTFDESWDNKSIEIAAGSTFTVTLASNPSTGYKWDAVMSNPLVMGTAGGTYSSTAVTPMPGSGGQEIWTFKGLAPGTSTLSMSYGQPWVGGAKNAKAFTLSVTVK
jgi:inhibitor of cysteine peptidase